MKADPQRATREFGEERFIRKKINPHRRARDDPTSVGLQNATADATGQVKVIRVDDELFHTCFSSEGGTPNCPRPARSGKPIEGGRTSLRVAPAKPALGPRTRVYVEDRRRPRTQWRDA